MLKLRQNMHCTRMETRKLILKTPRQNRIFHYFFFCRSSFRLTGASRTLALFGWWTRCEHLASNKESMPKHMRIE